MVQETDAFKILICDPVGLRLRPDGKADHREVQAHIETKGGVFHDGPLDDAVFLQPGKLHFFYQPHLSEKDELIDAAGAGQYDAVIAAATLLPPETSFPLGGVRIGAGTGNMGSRSWGGGDGEGGTAPLMNTPGINSRATAQMVMKALLRVMPDLPMEEMYKRVSEGAFDTGRDLLAYPTAKLEGRRIAILGYGNIGREVAKLAAAFGMHVVIYARQRHRMWIESEGFDYAPSPLEAARAADILSIHLGLGPKDPVTGHPANRGIVGEEILSALAPSATLINFDRGELVDVAALAEALARDQVRHAAIDADLFCHSSTKAISGPMQPYLSLVSRFADKLMLLPHAAADTDHPSRVQGAKQAVDQIFDAILHKRVVNRKGTLPHGYTDGGARIPPGVGPVSSRHLMAVTKDEAGVQSLAEDAALLAGFWQKLAAAPAEQRASILSEEGQRATLVANRLAASLRRQALLGPYQD